MEFEIPVGRYLYRHVPARVFSLGVERVDDATLPWLNASPTKALCDMIARVSSIRSNRDVLAWLDDMRLTRPPLPDQGQLTACAEHYRRPSVRHLARYLLKTTPTP